MWLRVAADYPGSIVPRLMENLTRELMGRAFNNLLSECFSNDLALAPTLLLRPV